MNDPHIERVAALLGIPEEDVTTYQRGIMKNLTFGLRYAPHEEWRTGAVGERFVRYIFSRFGTPGVGGAEVLPSNTGPSGPVGSDGEA